MKSLVVIACCVITITLATKRFRINEGNLIYSNTFPFMVPIWAERISKQGLNFSTFCGGTLISNEFVLTAAHCLTGNPVAVLMYFGANDTGKTSEPNRVKLRCPPENIILHSRYNFDTYKNDIALVKLPQKINFTDYIKPVKLPSQGQTNYDNARAIITGWGAVGSRLAHSDIIRYGVVKILPGSHCKPIYRRHFHSSNICIDGMHYRGCSGDSGGPVLFEETDRSFTQVGIASSQIKCEAPFPTSYVRVTSYLRWIHKRTGISF